jgi:hypothetical protein
MTLKKENLVNFLKTKWNLIYIEFCGNLNFIPLNQIQFTLLFKISTLLMTKFMLLMLCFVHFTIFLVHNDICGPFQTLTFIDYNYFMFINNIKIWKNVFGWKHGQVDHKSSLLGLKICWLVKKMM